MKRRKPAGCINEGGLLENKMRRLKLFNPSCF